jgi:hypothetical protein
VADTTNYGLTDTHTFSPTFLNEMTVSYLDSSSFRTATERVPPRDMGINVDEGYLGVGMSLNVSGGPNLSFTGPERQVYRNGHWKDVMTLVRGAHTVKGGYEGQYINFDLIRGNGARAVHHYALAIRWPTSARRVRQRELWIRRRRQLPAPLETSGLHSG